MNATPTEQPTDELVPESVIPPGHLPAMRYRDLPPPVPLRRMVGPSVILAGLALGSGEFILWPYIVYRSGFVFFWACLLGVATQYFINMEITRWSLATGESALTGFIRLSRKWTPLFLAFNVIPWFIPAWALGAAQIVSWLIWGPQFDAEGHLLSPHAVPIAIGGMVLCGAILTAGPVLYETIEKTQLVLVSTIMVSVVVLAAMLLKDRPDAIFAQISAVATAGSPDFIPPAASGLSAVALLGALAFAGAGGTLNLGQSNYIKDKGYGMGYYIGRITSPITGQEEAITEVGYHFPDTASNRERWRQWWRAASVEHFFSFFVTCVVCLVLLTLVSYVLFYDRDGQATAAAERYGADLGFVWGEAAALERMFGGSVKLLFLLMGIAILLTTEFGVLDATSRISTDLVKVAWLRDNARWTEGRLYYLFLWSTIGLGALLLAVKGESVEALALFKASSAMNGAVMFLYCAILLVLNRRCLPAAVRMSWPRMIVLAWAVLFFGAFTVWAGYGLIQKLLGSA
ncbi:MAG: Nramp family divalent metal transporter [Planctomycetales bacterium]|nr:Nramp family divalent metal transporter [Planctomycetales bacterium]